MQLVPYLNFNGNCAEAFDFYARALGGKVTMRALFREAPHQFCDQMPPETLDHVMHSQIESEGAVLMGADGPPPHPELTAGISINVIVDSNEKVERIFAALSEGGEVKVPVEESFFAHRWGALVDRYGKSWMVIHMKSPDAA